MDDRLIAKDIVNRMGNPGNLKVLEEDLTARELKSIIAESEFLIGERLHSIIGSVGVKTPFMSLASEADLRIEGILKQLKLDNWVYSLSYPRSEEAFFMFKSLFENRKNGS